MADDGRWASFASSERTERCLFGKEEVKLPHSLIEQNHIFKAVLSKETFDNLSEAQKKHLMKFLPSFPQNEEKEREETIRRLFAGENFNFGNPLVKFQTQLRDGYFAADIARYTKLRSYLKMKDWKFEMQSYYCRLVPEMLIARQKVFEELGQVPPDPQVPLNLPAPVHHRRSLEPKVRRKYHRILNDVREECEVMETSSEEEEEAGSTVQKSRRQLFKSLGPIPSPEPTVPAVLATHAAKPPAVNGDVSGEAILPSKRQRPISPVEVTDEDYRFLLRNHKRKKQSLPELPELDTQNITLQDILARCQANKKVTKSPSAPPVTTPPVTTQATPTPKRRGRGREREGRRARRKVKEEPMETSISDSQPPLSPTLGGSAASLEEAGELLHREDVAVPDFPLPESLSSRLNFGQASNFFSLLRDIIFEFPDSKVTLPKLEERVREWQESPSSALNAWFPSSPSWVDCLHSALRFLAGDLAGQAVENFSPYVDYKERAQQWRWIGPRRDGDAQLTSLFVRWLQCKEQTPVECPDSSQGSPPPPRVKTSYVVQPSTSEEKRQFQSQEWRRFEMPHKAYTYRLHGYESVVGPVKGVYSKDSAMTKAREHALLISERPSYVTILTLVRDAAARLPNGEGTRGDICELLKDSQFLSTSVTDAQVNTVVSGALDRLHSEKDPCVKYDVNRKLWIYLHRNRTEEEFERIHQAQAAAVKAKKSLQKPKTSKTIKEAISSQTSARQSLSLNVSNNSDVSVDGSLSPAQPSPTPSASSTSPRGAGGKHAVAKTSMPSIGEAATVSAALASFRTSQLQQAAAAKTTAPAAARLVGAATPQGVGKETVGRGVGLQGRAAPRQGAAALAQAQVAQQGAVTTVAPATLQGPPSAAITVSTAAPLAGGGAKLVTLSQAPATVGAPATTLVTAPARGAEGPVVARLMGQKVMSVGNLLAASGVQRLPAQTMTIKIQDGIMQPVAGGKPITLGGKPRGQVGVLQAGQGPIPTISIIPHSSQAAAISLAQTKLITTTANTMVSAMSAKTVANTIATGATKVPVASLVAAGKGGQPSLVGPQTIHLSQPRVVSPAQAGLVVTQLPTGNISLRQGLAGPGQAKVVSGSQASLVPAQFIVQQAPGTVKPLGKDGVSVASQGLATTQLVVSSAGTKSPNIQVVRTVLSQGGGLKPGQATILISQPALPTQPPGTVLSSAQVLPAASQAKSSGRGSPRGKPQPVYARIITPPPGMKLAAVGGAHPASSVGVLTTVNKLLSSAAASSGAVTVTLPAGALQQTVVSPVVTAALTTSTPTPAAPPKPTDAPTDS